MKNDIKSIKVVSDESLCCGCGACLNVCTKSAISIGYNTSGFLHAKVNDECVNCGVCLKVCPSYKKNMVKLFLEDDETWYAGKYETAIMGHASDADIRFCGQSGGVITALLSWLFNEHRIDCAAVNGFNVLEQCNKSVLAYDIDKIRASSGSSYIQSSTLSVIKGADWSRMAIVGTGCQMEAFNLLRSEKGNKDAYILIGLICEGSYSRFMLEDLADLKKNRGRIKEFRFRDKRNGGWPGGVYVKYSDDSEKKKNIKERTQLKECYETFRCLQCFDKNNIYADIVVGDPWCCSKEIDDNERKKGESIVVARTLRGKKLLEEALKERIITGQYVDGSILFEWNSFQEYSVDNLLITIESCKEFHYPSLYDSISIVLPKSFRINKSLIRERKRRLKAAYEFYNISDVDILEKWIKIAKRKIMFRNIINFPVRYIKTFIYVALNFRRIIKKRIFSTK